MELLDPAPVVKGVGSCYSPAPRTDKRFGGIWMQSELWQATYRILEQSIVPQMMTVWIQPLEFVRSEQSDPQNIRIYLSAQNEFSVKWVRDHYQKSIESAVGQITGARCEVMFSIKESEEYFAPAPSAATLQQGAVLAGDPYPSPSSFPQSLPENEPVYQQQPVRVSQPRSEITFDQRYTFDSFVVGASNQFAHASAVAVAEQPARLYNPLFLYSHPGLGKTHLLHAIANHVLACNPNARVAYLSAEAFVNELIDSLQHKKMAQFRTKYRDSYDLILIDDIQFIAGKKSTEEEFFHTFNALHSSRRQIVVTSDRPPKEIEGLEERVRTRFEWGMVADIHPPEIETRIAILKAKAERDDIYMPDDVATFLATYIKSNVRELEGTLIKLQMQASLTGSEISLEMAKQLLKAAIPEEGSHFTVESIQAAVAKYFHLKTQDFKSSSRTRAVALPRQIAMYLIRKYTSLGYKEIGHYFGGKDHSTIVHAFQKIEAELEVDSAIREAVEAIQNQL